MRWAASQKNMKTKFDKKKKAVIREIQVGDELLVLLPLPSLSL